MKPLLSSLLALPLFLALSLPLRGADVSYYGVVKAAQYQQTNATAPALLSSNAYLFTAFVVAATNNVVTNATVKAPDPTPLRTLLPDTNGISWRYEEYFNSQSAMDAVYPTGSLFSPANYTVTMYTTNDGVQSGTLGFSLLLFPLTYPTTPQITNLVQAQSIDTTRDFTLGWNSLGGSTIAIVQLTILDAASNLVYMTPAPFQPGALSGSSFSAVIPANTLPSGTNLQAHLTIGNPGMPNTNSYVGATGVAALANDTAFWLATRPAPARPHLQILPAQAGALALRLTGEPNRLYQIEATQDFLTWTTLFTTNSDSGVFDFTDSAASGYTARCYRGKVGQ